jgi:hypothetical protein
VDFAGSLEERAYENVLAAGSNFGASYQIEFA